MPKIFMVNWFRKSPQGGFLWPGFGENIRVIDWCLRRCDDESNIAKLSPVGYLPSPDSLKLEGLNKETIDLEAIFDVPKNFWLEEVQELKQYFKNQVGNSLPTEITKQLNDLESRINA